MTLSLPKRPELEFLTRKPWQRALAALFDSVALLLAWQATIELRILLNPFMGRQLTRTNLSHNAPSAAAMLFLWAGVAVWLRLYWRPRNSRVGGHLRNVMNATFLLSAVLIAYTFFSRGIGADDISRSFVLLFGPISFLFLMLANYAVLIASRSIWRRFRFQERVAVAGHGPHADLLVEQLSRAGGHSNVVGFILPVSLGLHTVGKGAPVLGTTETVAEVINRSKLDRIIIANGSLPPDEATACVRTARRMGVVTAHALAGLVDEDLEKASLRVGNGLAIVELGPWRFTRKKEVVKRLFDSTFATLLLLFFLPLLAVLAIVVILTSPGPALYLSDRVGRGGRHFTFYKFRTMFVGADHARDQAGVNEQNGHLFKVRVDPRVTPFGRFMRRHSLDELPQLFNVLIGTMSLVGPRPLPAKDLEADGCSRRFATWARERAEVMPGITCLWQIRGRSDLPFEKMMELDLEYIREWSLGLDLEILLETPLAVLSRRGAY
jgi:exopolysaccharide biosynthesis polyprenyl glycosylphosphotransferase